MMSDDLQSERIQAPVLKPLISDEHRPFWSVIVPIYKRKEFLSQCLGSILDQDPGPEHMEIIVSDDASPNDLRDFVEGLGRGRINYHRNEENQGLYPNTNNAIRRSKGYWIHVLHDDDWVDLNFYSKMRKSIEGAAGDVGVVFCTYKNIHDRDRTTWSPPAFRQESGVMSRDFLRKLALGNPLNLPAVTYKRTSFERVGLFREDLPFSADWEWYVRSAVSMDWYHNTEQLAFYRIHGNNLTFDLLRQGKTCENLRRTLEIFSDILPKDIVLSNLTQARQIYAKQFLTTALGGLNQNNHRFALRFALEALKVSPDACAYPEFGRLLQHHAAGDFRQKFSKAIIKELDGV